MIAFFGRCLILLSLLGHINAYAAEANSLTSKGVGASSCASSTCHGSIQPWAGSNIRGNEYLIWSNLDKHHNSHAALNSNQAKKMMDKLGESKPATQNSACLSCHGPIPNIASEGVSCESCHGNAQKWLSSHKTNSHTGNIKNGMTALSQSKTQASTCLACHLGDEHHFVTHRMMAAGHPRLNFEIATFTALQPAHFHLDQDWKKRKGNYSPIQAWAISQVIASQLVLNNFTNPKINHDGIFPELTLFDCHSCHRFISHKRSEARWGIGPGRLHLNDSNLVVLRAIIAVMDPQHLLEFDSRIAGFHEKISNDEASTTSIHQSAQETAQYLERYTTLFEKENFDDKTLKKILVAIIDAANQRQLSEPASAEQAYMAISNIAANLYQSGNLKAASAVNAVLSEMRNLLSNDDQYQPDQFSHQLNQLKSIVAKE